MCNIRLIGDASKPNEYMGISLQDLTAHSASAAARLRQSRMQNSGMNTVVPVCIPPSVVRKLVRSFYTGILEMQEDVEQMLVLANCLQVGAPLLRGPMAMQ